MIRVLINSCFVASVFFLGIDQPFAGHLVGKPQHVIDMTHDRTMGKPDHPWQLKMVVDPASNNKSLLDSKTPKQKDVKARNRKPCPEKGVWTDCFATFKSDDGTKYVGEWKEDASHGHGTETYANGDKYIGEWKDGKRNGQGAFTYADGKVKKGIWENGEFLGAKP